MHGAVWVLDLYKGHTQLCIAFNTNFRQPFGVCLPFVEGSVAVGLLEKEGRLRELPKLAKITTFFSTRDTRINAF